MSSCIGADERLERRCTVSDPVCHTIYEEQRHNNEGNGSSGAKNGLRLPRCKWTSETCDAIYGPEEWTR